MLSTPARLPKQHQFLFNVIGVILLFLGGVSFVNLFINWHLSHLVTPAAPLYALLYCIVAYQFFTEQRWLFYIFLFNLTANLFLVGFHYYLTGVITAVAIWMLVLNVGLVGYLYTLRRKLGDSLAGRIATFLVLILWLWAMYTISIHL
jgi:hypothetical protein